MRGHPNPAALRELNLLQAATRELPSEILSLIFEDSIFLNCREPDEDKRWESELPVVQVLGAVCSTWRQVAWSTPALWTDIEIDFKSSDIRPQACLMKLYLENSGELPLSLSLAYEEDMTYPVAQTTLVHPLVDKLIEEALWRVVSLHLSYPPSLSLWLYHASEMASLDRLWIYESRLTRDFELDLSNFSSLSVLDMWGVSGDVILPWNSITRLFLSQIPTEVCAQLLSQCPNLERFEMDSPVFPVEEIEPPALPNVVILPHLETLTWESAGTEWDALVLRCVQTPALQSLWWMEDPFVDNLNPHLATFLQRLPTSFRSLKIKNNSPNGFPLFFLPSNVETETMEFGTFGFSPNVFSSILFPLKHRGDPQSSWPFPKLKQLSIHSYPAWEGPTELPVDARSTIDLVTTMALRAAALGQIVTLQVFGLTLNWDLALFPGPLYGGENLILRVGEDQVVPLWYQQLVPHARLSWSD
ncbi:hypothetical protein D9756_002706 [Leucocoprinus leucothites]|uniref:F-box domain-containing protein n=1 Tax=Leucocoprinus leucothites TaxID=201217 RepID=A0A8H5GC84_9AGAR|nr:hypothetical protein D9756_002706 [Leucoagaricus leucothites]